MCETCVAPASRITAYQENRYDPTRTLVLRNKFTAEMNKRFGALRGAIRHAIVTQDVFGMKPVPTYYSVRPRAFDFPRSGDKVTAFMQWLQQQVDKGILQTGTMPQLGRSMEEPWTNLYIQDSYKRGVIRSRYEMGRAGMATPNLDATGGISASMSTPFHMDRVGLIYTRVYNELKGVTDAMDHQISRVLAQGIADGDGPMLLARKINATISGAGMGELGLTDTLGRFIPAQRRAKMIARTEIIRAHHQAMVQEYRNWGVEGVTVQAEWRTAGDDRVCEECSSMEGNVYTLDEIENMIPRHPQCRCLALPKAADGVRQETREVDEELMDIVDLGDENPDLYSHLIEDRKEWYESLKASEKDALISYRDQKGFIKMNNALRSGNLARVDRKTVKHIGDLEYAMSRHRLPENLKVFRGMEVPQNFNLTPGQVFREDGFMSASPSSSIAGRFSTPLQTKNKGIFFELSTADNVPGAYISAGAAEPEVLINAGAYIQIINVRTLSDGIIHVTGKIIGG